MPTNHQGTGIMKLNLSIMNSGHGNQDLLIEFQTKIGTLS